ncbi:Hypothetical protein PHPALM_18971, partial [Phytophthora palmivora]
LMKMDAFTECEEQKERVKACYGDWFQKLWGGSFDRADCEQETQDYRQCVQDAMQRRKEDVKRKADYDWMDRTKEKTDEMADNAKTRARKARERAREEKEEAKGTMKDKASDVTSKVQDTADSWAGKIKGFAKKAESKARGED